MIYFGIVCMHCSSFASHTNDIDMGIYVSWAPRPSDADMGDNIWRIASWQVIAAEIGIIWNEAGYESRSAYWLHISYHTRWADVKDRYMLKQCNN